MFQIRCFAQDIEKSSTKKAFEQAKIPKKKLQQEINKKATTPGKKSWVDLLGEVMGTSETIGGGRSGGGGGY